jgi:hypothetical protein
MGMARRRAVQAGLPMLKRKENDLLLSLLRQSLQ